MPVLTSTSEPLLPLHNTLHKDFTPGPELCNQNFLHATETAQSRPNRPRAGQSRSHSLNPRTGRPTLANNQPHIQCVLGAVYQGHGMAWHEAAHSPPKSSKLKPGAIPLVPHMHPPCAHGQAYYFLAHPFQFIFY
jgi:hypothetical protein